LICKGASADGSQVSRGALGDGARMVPAPSAKTDESETNFIWHWMEIAAAERTWL
jgi:hypothetical protein